MNMSEWLWGVIGVLGVAMGVAEITQGRYLLASTAIIVGGLLIASSAAKLVKKS